MAVIFVQKFVNQTDYESRQDTACYSTKYAYEKVCNVGHRHSLLLMYFLQRGYLCEQSITTLVWLKTANHPYLAKIKMLDNYLHILFYKILTILSIYSIHS